VRLGYNAGISSCCRFIDSTVSSKSGQTAAPRCSADWSMSCVPMATSLSVGVYCVVVCVGDGYRVVVGCRVWVSTFRVALEGASIRTERSYLVRACSRSGSDLRVMPVSAASQAMPASAASQAMPALAASQAMPALAASQAMPASAASQAMPALAASQAMPALAASQAMVRDVSGPRS